MTTDDDMREIEAALDILIEKAEGCWPDVWEPMRAKLLALIRQKLPQTDAEHERAVEAWRLEATSYVREGLYVLHDKDIDEALRLMRARPVADKAAGDYVKLHEAAGQLWACLENQAKCGEIQVTTRLRCFMDRFAKVIDEVADPEGEAERAGVR